MIWKRKDKTQMWFESIDGAAIVQQNEQERWIYVVANKISESTYPHPLEAMQAAKEKLNAIQDEETRSPIEAPAAETSGEIQAYY
jgi:hypothetical protein